MKIPFAELISKTARRIEKEVDCTAPSGRAYFDSCKLEEILLEAFEECVLMSSPEPASAVTRK